MEQQHYDVFISFKNTAADGSQSVDAQLASEIYKQLTERGISAFYSNVKLLELGEATYKKAIEEINALINANKAITGSTKL